MWDEPDDLVLMGRLHLRVRRLHGLKLRARLLRAAGWSLGLAALAFLPAAGRGQTFIRVAPPSTQEQDQSPVNAMPNPGGSGAADGNAGTQGEAILSDSSGANSGATGKGWIHGWRPSFYLNTSVGYDSNIFYQRDARGDFVSSISPGIVLGWGDYRALLPKVGQFSNEYQIPSNVLTEDRYFYVDYHPTIQLFADHGSEDSVDEYLLANGSYNFSKLLLQESLLYQKLSDAEIDAGTRVDRSLLTASLMGTYTVDDKSSFDVTLYNYDAEYEGVFESSEDFRLVSFFNYQYAPKTQISGGFTIGYITPELSPNQLYEQGVARVRWSASDKFYLSLTGGVEVREVDNGRDLTNPVFDLSLNYLPFNGTSFLLNAARAAVPSDDELGNDIVRTAVQFGVQQRLVGRIYATGSVAYTDADYQRLAAGAGVSRDDRYFQLAAGAGMDVTQYAGILLACAYLNVNSTVAIHTFNEAQVKLQVNLTY